MEKLIRLAVIAWSEMRVVERFGPKMAAAAACAVFAFFAVLAATGLAVAAMWLAIAESSGPVAASLWSALLFLFIAVALLVTAKLVLRSNAAPRIPHPSTSSGLPFSEDLVLMLQKTFGNHKTATVVSAILAGLAFGTGHRHR